MQGVSERVHGAEDVDAEEGEGILQGGWRVMCVRSNAAESGVVGRKGEGSG